MESISVINTAIIEDTEGLHVKMHISVLHILCGCPSLRPAIPVGGPSSE